MTAKPVSFYLALPDGTCLIYPEDALPITLQKGHRPYIDHRLYEVEDIIPCLSEGPGEQQVLELLKRLRNVIMPKIIDLGPKKQLIVSDSSAVLILLKDVNTKASPRFTLGSDSRLRDEDADVAATDSNKGVRKPKGGS